jgi:5-formyltetrahydrofolate cyclo-ligase
LQHPGSKQEIRDRMRALRRDVSAVEAEGHSSAVGRQVLSSREAESARIACVYASSAEEVSTAAIIAALLSRLVRVAVPDWEGWREGCGIRLVAVSGPGDLLPARPVPRPRFSPERVVPPEQVDLFLVPGLAFTARGDRLGMGGGYYDRLLALAAPGAAILGLAFPFQLIDQLPVEPHDVPVHRVISP